MTFFAPKSLPGIWWSSGRRPRCRASCGCLVQDLIQKTLAEQMLEVYHATNEFLVQQGVMAEIDLRPMMKRTPSAARTGFGSEASLASRRAGVPSSLPADSGSASGYQGDQRSTSLVVAAASVPTRGARAVLAATLLKWRPAGRLPVDGRRSATRVPGILFPTKPACRPPPRRWPGPGCGRTGVMGHLKRLLIDNVAGFEDTRRERRLRRSADAGHLQGHSAHEAESRRPHHTFRLTRRRGVVYGQAQVDRAAGAVASSAPPH